MRSGCLSGAWLGVWVIVAAAGAAAPPAQKPAPASSVPKAASAAVPATGGEFSGSRLLAACAMRPQGYPAGAEYAQPDVSAAFRWNFYSDEAIPRYEDARMLAHIAPYNPLEEADGDVPADGDVKAVFFGKNVTAGSQALRADFPAAAIGKGVAEVTIKGVAGPPSHLSAPAENDPATASCFGPHYRWIKLDAFNPDPIEVRVRVCGVPLVLHPGSNTVAVKTADAVSGQGDCIFNAIRFQVTGPEQDLVLFLDNVRMEQEVPAVIPTQGRMFQFPAREDPKGGFLVWPGFTPVPSEAVYTPQVGFGWVTQKLTRANLPQKGRSLENGILFGHCAQIDSPFRMDVPNGRYGICIFAAPAGAPGERFAWQKGGTVKVNGREMEYLPKASTADVRRVVLGGEAWDYRPGVCVWEQLCRPIFHPATTVLYADASQGAIILEFPKATALRAVMAFPEKEKDECLKEVGRFNYLLAQSWDTTHPWVKGTYAQGVQYVGCHDELTRPEGMGDRLKTLKPAGSDVARGFLIFHRGLVDAVYPDTVPSPEEAAFKDLRGFVAQGQRAALTLGILPLAETKGLKVLAGDLVLKGGTEKIPASQVDVRVSRYHQKTMVRGPWNQDYNYVEHFLVRRPQLDLYPGAARRVYFDIAAPQDAKPGEYLGEVAIASADGKPLARVPVLLQVLPFRLQDPPVYFAANSSHPLLRKYGFNTLWGDVDEAEKAGARGYIMTFGSEKTVKVEQRWNLAEGPAGKTPRGFVWPGPGMWSETDGAVQQKLASEIPKVNLISGRIPTYAFWSTSGMYQQPAWCVPGAPKTGGMAGALESDRKAGKEFWFVDALDCSCEQAVRFSYGAWFWAARGSGRYSSMVRPGHDQDRTNGPYFTLGGAVPANTAGPVIASQTEGEFNPSRQLVILRAGIDDYRYLHTLDYWIKRAEGSKAAEAALGPARQFRDKLANDVQLDLTIAYRAAAHSDDTGFAVEYWTPMSANPWVSVKFEQVRRDAAVHIVKLKKAMGE